MGAEINPLVSVITPCYNGEKYLDRYFDSLEKQTYNHLQVIFVNDGSTDRTEKIALKRGEELEHKGMCFCYLSQKNSGQAAALNAGLKKVSGEYLTWLDSDDEMLPNCIESKVHFLQKNLEYDYCAGRAIGVKEDAPDIIVEEKIPDSDKDRLEVVHDLIQGKGCFVCGAYMLRTTFLDHIISEREIFTGPGGQNAQLLIPAAWYGELGIIDEIVYRYYLRQDSHSHQALSDSKKAIQQLYYFQDIVIATLTKIGEEKLLLYIPEVERYYARLRFGHALDTKEKSVVLKQMEEMEKLHCLTFHDRYLVFRYTNAFINIIRPVE